MPFFGPPSYEKSKRNQPTSTDGVDVILCILVISYQRYRRFCICIETFPCRYATYVISKLSVSMIYNVTKIKLVSVDITYWSEILKHTLLELNKIRDLIHLTTFVRGVYTLSGFLVKLTGLGTSRGRGETVT